MIISFEMISNLLIFNYWKFFRNICESKHFFWNKKKNYLSIFHDNKKFSTSQKKKEKFINYPFNNSLNFHQMSEFYVNFQFCACGILWNDEIKYILRKNRPFWRYFFLSFFSTFFYAKNVSNRLELMIILIDRADNCIKYLKSLIIWENITIQLWKIKFLELS